MSASGELMSIADIARLVRANPSTVHNWRARSSDFPSPADVSSREALFGLT